MGSTLQRKMLLLQHVTLPRRCEEVAAICGAQIRYEVDWDSFGDNILSVTFLDYGSCHRLAVALAVICRDERHRAAIGRRLKLVRLGNVGSREEMRLAFADGVLEMRCAYGLKTEGLFSEEAIHDLLAASL
jgi:hypothetical protein